MNRDAWATVERDRKEIMLLNIIEKYLKKKFSIKKKACFEDLCYKAPNPERMKALWFSIGISLLFFFVKVSGAFVALNMLKNS